MTEKYRCINSLENSYSGGPYAVSSDGSYIVYACHNDIKIVDTSYPYITKCLDAVVDEPITSLVLKPLSNQILLSASGRHIQEWNLITLKPNHRFLTCDEGHVVMGMAYDSSGDLVATAGVNGSVMVWNLENKSRKLSLRVHNKAVNSVVFNPVLNMLCSGSEDGNIVMWHLNEMKGRILQNITAVVSLTVSQDGMTLISLGRNDTAVTIWSIGNWPGEITWRRISTGDSISAVCLVDPQPNELVNWMNNHVHDDRRMCLITVGGGFPSIKSWIESSKRTQQFEIEVSSVDFKETIKGFKSAILFADNEGLLCVTDEDEFIFCDLFPKYRRGIGKAPFHLTLTKRILGYCNIKDMKMYLNNRFLAVRTNWQVQAYEIASMSCVYVLPRAHSDVSCLDTCVTKLVTGHEDTNLVKLWDISNGKLLGIGRGHVKPVRAIAISKPENEYVVSGSSDGELRFWKTHKHTKLIDWVSKAAHKEEISSIAINKDGKLVCSGSLKQETAFVWNLTSLQQRKPLTGHKGGVSSVEFSHARDVVIIASNEGTVKVWNVIGMESKIEHVIRNKEVITKALSIGDLDIHFVSCGADGLKIWPAVNAATNDNDQHGEKIRALAIGSNNVIATVGFDAPTINLWGEERRAMDDVVNAYLRRYPYRTYEVPYFYMHGLRKVEIDISAPIYHAWYIHGLVVIYKGRIKAADTVGTDVNRGDIKKHSVPDLDEVMLKTLKRDFYDRCNREYEHYKHGMPFGFTVDEYLGCIRQIGLSGLRERLQSCLKWMTNNNKATHLHDHWYTTDVARFQDALKQEFGWFMKFRVKRCNIGNYYLTQVTPYLDSNLNVVRPPYGVGATGAVMQIDQNTGVLVETLIKLPSRQTFLFYYDISQES